MQPEFIFVDSSAFYALMDRSDPCHEYAKALWPVLLENPIHLSTSNYVVSETATLMQFRLGFEAASLWYRDVLGVVGIDWIDEITHRHAYELWVNLGRRLHSLVDCASYVLMYQRQIEKAFCFKRNFVDQGFKVLPMLNHYANDAAGNR